MEGQKQSRTEKPTSRRLQKAREKGQVARSKEVPSAAVLLGGFLFLAWSCNYLFRGLEGQMSDLIRMRIPEEIDPGFVAALAGGLARRFALLAGPTFLAALTLSVAANFAQTGGVVFSWHQLGLKVNKLSPKNGLSRIFSKAGLVEVVKSVALVVVTTVISWQIISEHWHVFPRLVLMDVHQFLYWIGTIAWEVCLRIGIFLLLMAAADFAFQKYRFLEQMKMTKQEIRDELKETEGDPLTKGRIRRIQREMARRRMMADVPRADVVITNPTHYAVALSYRQNSMEAPKVVAKGVGFLAARIKELAQRHDVPLVENPPLARALYRSVEVGAFIPVDLYRAVAEILAYIYKTRSRWRG